MNKKNILNSASPGFTLIELIIATALSIVVLGILAVALSFSLRVWEREQNRKTSDMPNLVALLKWQLASFDPVYFTFDARRSLIFQGTEDSLAFTTDYSIKALSKGVPVIARYVFVAKAGKIFYAEMPIDPYKPDAVKDFLKRKPDENDKTWPRFFATEAAGFSFSYAGGDAADRYSEVWEDDSAIPAMVVLKWVPAEGATPFTYSVIPNFLFARKIDKASAALQSQGAQSGEN
jgi:hypothetical protein